MIASSQCCRERGGWALAPSSIRTALCRCRRAVSSRTLANRSTMTGPRTEMRCWKSSVRDLRRRHPRRRSNCFVVAARLAALADKPALSSKPVELGRVVHQDHPAVRGVRSPDGELIEQPAVIDLEQRRDLRWIVARNLRRVRPIRPPQYAPWIRGDQRFG